MNLTREPTTVQAPPAETPNQAPEPPTRGAHDGLGEFAKRALRTCAPLRYLCSLNQLVLPLTMSNPHRPPRNRNNANNANNGTGPGSNRPLRDVCHDFWRTGTCSRTTCRFRHERPATATAATATAGGGRGRGGQSSMNGAGTRTNVRSSFANQGINTATGTASSGGMAQNLQPMDAGVAMTILENYCGPSGSVTELPRAGPLIRIINCIMSKGSNWRSEDRQDALQKLATNHGKLRLQELLEWENVSTKAETVSQTMSFQLGYIVILSLFCCEALVDCPLRGRCNELLSLVHQSYTTIGSRIVASMDSMVNNLSTRETDTRFTHPEGMPFHQMLQAVTSLHKEYIQRFKTAPEDYPQIKEMSDHLGRWLSVWSTNSISDPAELSAQDKGRLVSKLKRDIGHLSTILGRESTCVAPQPTLNNGTINYTSERSRDHSDEFEVNPTIKELVIRTFMPPGHLREGGPRHDNDHASVVDITISPTQQELTSLLPQYIPATFHDAPHHLPMHSMDRLLDIQFRLLREELVYPIKAATNLLFSDLKQPPTVDTILKGILNEKGGRYKGVLDRNAVFFSVYTNVELGTISADRRGIAVTLSFDTPPGKGRNQKLKERQAHWESAGKKRLNIGGLIALVWDKSEIHLGLITSDTKYLVASAKGNPNRLSIKVCFFEPILERRAVEQFLANNSNGRSGRGMHLMFEIQTLYEASRPFLEALKVEPTTVAFSKYLIQHEKDSLINLVMDPPEYTTKRGFEWDLSCLFNSPAPIRMKVNDSQSIVTAEYYMKNRSDTLLDPSQAEAMISCLTREVALIQGPPGTGKSYTAIQLLRVLVRNRVGPILMVAFTNHALDHLLESVLKNNITRKIVRLGGRSQSEALQPYLLDKVERFQASYLQRGVNSAYGEMKRAEEAFEENMKSFKTLKTLEEFQSMQRLESLKNLDIIGCTTTGAARLLDLLKGLQPKIILVEEAGQVLEAHSLATLVPSVQHLIMIGDPQQLRPTINNYEFATENPYGGHLFKFDQSLMERLAWSGLPMAQLSIQRRMRPAVSNLIRGCLYPKLQDHASVRDYPRIRGMAKDVWFLHHTNKEDGGGEDAVSKCNMFEVAMVKSLVQFFLRQGVYNSPTSIVVLCAYLGQLTKVRDALSDCKLSVVLDERDEDLLVARGDDQEESHQVVKKQVDVSKQVRIRTVDNFQGEEADIVILSLVRNPGKGNGGGIGFLKSSNRANVALSRARHGMFVLGNGEVLENSNGIWPSVIQEFKQQDAYGEAFPFACHRHPNDTQWLSSPKEIDTLFPDGRCLLPCGVKLGCGHACPSKCHPDDDFHTTIRCAEPCDRLCPLGHPCDKLCFEECCSWLLAIHPLFFARRLLGNDCGAVNILSQFLVTRAFDSELVKPFVVGRWIAVLGNAQLAVPTAKRWIRDGNDIKFTRATGFCTVNMYARTLVPSIISVSAKPLVARRANTAGAPRDVQNHVRRVLNNASGDVRTINVLFPVDCRALGYLATSDVL
ncbi:hypothetical protein FS842_007802 [Serendipita sp. 407]|nr:hypothetical protein FS842_007802 [Serendipita sp. 407]